MRKDHKGRKTMKKVRDALARTDAAVEVDLVFECPVPWEEMRPLEACGQAVRHCERCDCRVYDLADTPKAAVVSLVRSSGGDLCGQVQRRTDGRVVFGECTADLNVQVMRGRLVVR